MLLTILSKNRRLWAGVALTGAVALLTAGSGSATDGFSAPTSAVNVAAGGSADVPESLNLDAQNVDVLLALDTTGSMGGPTGALGTAKADATAIVNTLAADFTPAGGTVKFAVADFQDYYPTFSSTTTDVPYRLDQGLTDNAATVQSAVDGVPSGDGGDIPEAYFRLFYK